MPHDPRWATRASEEAARLRAALGANLLEVHHIGSTAIPGIEAKPIIDLMPVVQSLDLVDQSVEAISRIGYDFFGEYGIAGRRFCTWSNPADGRREVHVHIFASGSVHIARHLAFRDYMRQHPDEALAYEAEKRRCRDLHAGNSMAYSQAKSAWILGAEARAMKWYALAHQPHQSNSH